MHVGVIFRYDFPKKYTQDQAYLDATIKAEECLTRETIQQIYEDNNALVIFSDEDKELLKTISGLDFSNIDEKTLELFLSVKTMDLSLTRDDLLLSFDEMSDDKKFLATIAIEILKLDQLDDEYFTHLSGFTILEMTTKYIKFEYETVHVEGAWDYDYGLKERWKDERVGKENSIFQPTVGKLPCLKEVIEDPGNITYPFTFMVYNDEVRTQYIDDFFSFHFLPF